MLTVTWKLWRRKDREQAKTSRLSAVSDFQKMLAKESAIKIADQRIALITGLPFLVDFVAQVFVDNATGEIKTRHAKSHRKKSARSKHEVHCNPCGDGEMLVRAFDFLLCFFLDDFFECFPSKKKSEDHQDMRE